MTFSRLLEVEIGCGKGKFLFARGIAHPEIDFIGIDRAGRSMRHGREKLEKQRLSNLKFIKARADFFVQEELKSESVSVFHIYFPDPWPKKRHHKRRLLQDAFFKLLHSRLAPGGRIEIATDFENYFAQIQFEVKVTRNLWSDVRLSVNERLFCPEFKTNYELKYEKAGKPLYYLELLKG